MEPNALTELIPDWKEKGAPVRVQTKGDRVYMLKMRPNTANCQKNRPKLDAQPRQLYYLIG